MVVRGALGRAGDFSLSETDTLNSYNIQTVTNQGLTQVTSVSVHQSNQPTQTGNSVTGDFTLVPSGSTTATTIETDTNQSLATTTTVTATTSSGGKQTGNSITGAFSLSQGGSTGSTTSETQTNQGLTSTVTGTEVNDFTQTQTGNNVTGDFTLAETTSITSTSVETDTNQTLATTTSATSTDTATSSNIGNNITGSFSLARTETVNAASTQTITNQTSTATLTTSDSSQTTATQTGNNITGDFTLAQTSTVTDTSDRTSSDQTYQDPTNHQVVTRTDTVSQTGNNITGVFTLTQTETSTNLSTIITSDQGMGQTVFGSGSGSLTVVQSGNSVTGDFSLSQTQSNSTTTTTTVTNQLNTTTTITAADNQTAQQTGNNVTGSYSLAQTDTVTSNGTGTGVDARGTFSLTQTGNVVTTVSNKTGNSVTGDFTLTVTQTASTGQDKTGHDQFNDPGSSYSQSQTESNTVTTTENGNVITGADTQTVTGTDTVSAHETTAVEAPGYNLTQIDVTTSGSQRTGNSITGSYTLAGSANVTTTFIESAANADGSFELEKSLTVGQSNNETGNSVTGDFTVTLTTGSGETDFETDTFTGGAATFTNTMSDDVTRTNTGNHLTGGYTLSDNDSHSITLIENGSVPQGAFALTETTTGTSVAARVGNEITGIYTLTSQGTTDSYQVTETGSANGDPFTLTETGFDTVTASATGNQVTGYLDQYDTVTDNYTLNEEGTEPAGAFDEVVTGTDTYRDQETGTPQQGNYSVYQTGTGSYYRSYNSGGTLVPGPGDLAYTLTETYSSLRGGISQTTLAGADRYSLLELWLDSSDPGMAAASGNALVPGMAEHRLYGAPVALVSWWNAPLAADRGNPWGNSGAALRDTWDVADTSSSGGGGDFGPDTRSLTDKLFDPVQEYKDERGFWEKASEWLPGVSKVRDLGAAATSLGRYLGGGTAEQSLQPMLERMHQNGGLQSELADLAGSFLAYRQGDYGEMERLALNAAKKNTVGSIAIGIYAYGVQEYQYGARKANGDVVGAEVSRVSFWAKQIDKMVPFEAMNYVTYGATAPLVSMQERDLLGQLSSLDPEAARRGEAAVPATQFVIDVALTLATLPIGGEGAEAAAGMRAMSAEARGGMLALRGGKAAEGIFAREVGVFARGGEGEAAAILRSAAAREPGIMTAEGRLAGSEANLIGRGGEVAPRTFTEAFPTPAEWAGGETPRASRLGRLFQVENAYDVHAQQLGEEAARMLGVDPKTIRFEAVKIGEGRAGAFSVDEAGRMLIEFDPAVLASHDAAGQLRVGLAEVQHSRQFTNMAAEVGDLAAAGERWNRFPTAYREMGRRGYDVLGAEGYADVVQYMRNEIEAEQVAYRTLRGQGIWSPSLASRSRAYIEIYEGLLRRIGAAP